MATGGMPRYLEIAAAVREMIASGVLAVGDNAPSENELALENDVARGTAARALEVLAAEGLLRRRQGKGSLVIGVPEDLAEVPVGPGARIRARLPGQDEIHEGGIPAGSLLLVITRPGRPDEILQAGRAVIVTVALAPPPGAASSPAGPATPGRPRPGPPLSSRTSSPALPA